MSIPSPLHRLATQHFDECYKHKQGESFLSQPKHTISFSRQRTLRTQYLHLGFFFAKAVYNSYKLQRLLQAARFLFIYSFTHTNTLFLFRHLPAETVIFIDVCFQMKCFSGDSFSCFRSRFC